MLILIQGLGSWKSDANMQEKNEKIHVFRLKPGEDLKRSIVHFVKENKIQAGWINACVGSLTDYQIRFANCDSATGGNGHFEIVSLTGLVSLDGVHLHVAVADSTGKVIGGHLMDGCIVYTTAEIVLESSSSYRFLREKDGTTPYKELRVEKL
jgi:hypothetical protein